MLIVVPARYASTRFPAKPLAPIGGITMVRRTARIAELATKRLQDCEYVVATDHDDIASHCKAHGIPVVMTASDLPSGSDRALAAVKTFKPDADTIINLQGDAPFTPPEHVISIASALSRGADVATPYVKLSWDALDKLRADKATTPFSGTTVIVDKNDKAVWFSKNIIPAIRKEAALRQTSQTSPVCRHIGLYGYRRAALEKFVAWPESAYEKLEGLEQLRLLKNGLTINCVEVTPPKVATSGIDTPADLARAEDLIAQHGDPFLQAETP